MTSQSNLDLQGNFRSHPLAGLLVEISQAKLSGALRLSREDRKTMVYFDSGSIIYAVSNARALRFSDYLLDQKRITPEFLAENQNFSNDLEFAVIVQRKGAVARQEIAPTFSEFLESIIVDLLSWAQGDWVFSPLARLKNGIAYNIDLHRLLAEYGRNISAFEIAPRFRSREETFMQKPDYEPSIELQPLEAFVLSRFTGEPLSVDEIVSLSSMPETPTLQTLYTLWLAGLLTRGNWNPAFSDMKISSMLSANLKLKQPAARRIVETPPKPEPQPVVPEAVPEPIEEISLEQYLERVEKAETHYDILGVQENADLAKIRRSYFALAKQFHPDRYHKEGGATLRRIEHAFTELAHAHETLKNQESRSSYDFKMRKELAEKEKRRAAAAAGEKIDDSAQAERAAADFEQALELIQDRDYEAAVPMLARAVHFAPQNARYHAYYGKALSADEAQRHKAEGELQAAVRLEPQNPEFRLMLVQFFIQVNLVKRAEGELNRMLAAFPDNAEAQRLLDRLQRK